jgi:polyhydroxybutyrate depolymerase
LDGYENLPDGRRVLLRGDAVGAGQQRPAVVVLHGYTGTPAGIERNSGMTVAARARGFLAVYPEGTPVAGGGFGWDSGATVFATASGIDDIGDLSEVLDLIIQRGCVDPARIVLAGESNGAGMAIRAACDPSLNGRISAVAAIIPAVGESTVDSCGNQADRPIPLVAVAGTIDVTVPYGGRPGLLGQVDWFQRVAHMLDGCTTDGAVAMPESPTATRLDPSGCRAPAVLHTVADAPHTWPGGPHGNGGLRPGTFDTNSAVLDLAG